MNNYTKTWKHHNKKEKVNYSYLLVGAMFSAWIVLALVR